MSKFMWMTRPKKPSQDGSLDRQLYNGMSIKELNEEVESFMKMHTHIDLNDISLEWDYDDSYVTMQLSAAGKSHAQYMQEIAKYKKEMKAYRIWQATNADEIVAFKEAEKKRIAKGKLQRTQERLKKEMAAVEAKLEKA